VCLAASNHFKRVPNILEVLMQLRSSSVKHSTAESPFFTIDVAFLCHADCLAGEDCLPSHLVLL
jgi:hypothetical protein